MNELVSVIVPVYNVEKYLPKCIDSILNQTYRNLEVLLVDDGSTDGSGHICDEYALKDSRIRVFHKENGGQGSARNVGIDNTRGRRISFIDSDDYIAKEMIEILQREMEKNHADMVICNYICVDENGKAIECGYNPPINDEILDTKGALQKLAEDKFWHYATPVNKLYHKKLFANVRFRENKFHEDEFIAHQLIGECEYIACISDALYFYVQRSGSTMHIKTLFNRIDCAESFLDRTNYVLEKNMQDTAEKLLKLSVVYMSETFMGCKRDEKLRIRFKEVKQLYNKTCKYVLKKCRSKKKVIFFAMFMLSPRLFCMYLNHRIKKQQEKQN